MRSRLAAAAIGLAICGGVHGATGVAASRALASASATAPKPKCAVTEITYDTQEAVVAATGRCSLGQRQVPATWTFAWTGYSDSGVTFGTGNKGIGRGSTFTLNPARFSTVKITFTMTTRRTARHAASKASRTASFATGGIGLISDALGSGPANTPPAVTDGASPLCPFHDPYAEGWAGGAAAGFGLLCGIPTSSACAFVTPPTMTPDGTIRAGRWLCPGGRCAAPPKAAVGPYDYFGFNVFAVTGLICQDGPEPAPSAFSFTLIDSDGSTCTLHPSNAGGTRFQLPPEWGGVIRVTFGGWSVGNGPNSHGGLIWPGEYETGQFTLHGTENGCTSPDWHVPSIPPSP